MYYGMHFTRIANYLALKALKKKSILAGRMLHRVEKLLEHDFDVIYQASKEHVVPDLLSRIYLVDLTVAEGMEEDCCQAVWSANDQ